MTSSIVNAISRASTGILRVQCNCRAPALTTVAYLNTKIPSGETYNFSGEIPIVATKVELRFNLEKADWLTEEIKSKLVEQQKNRITKDGDFYLMSDKTRKQMLNQADCINRLRHMLFEASRKPREPTPEEIELAEQRKARRAAAILREKRHDSMKRRWKSESFYD